MSEKTISKEEIKKLAELAKLDIAGESSKLSEILSDTLNYIDTLNELDTSGTEETFQVTDLTNVFHKDISGNALPKEKALSNAKEEVDGLFSTEAVFDR
jgi:aspartyl-tRNA(Asn)/glutamyl-tRNA(Gln) amidotransferase subunit C